ncbi:hypothetical protein [Tabrizicola sp.]|uniref:hypothetical protein n=1 Tax=Tabrizicola sp. TaxID=2005166 RepID=UPI003F40FBBE
MTVLKPALLALLIATGPLAAMAEELPVEVREALTDRVDAFTELMLTGRVADGMDFLPEEFVAGKALQVGMPLEEFESAMRAQMAVAEVGLKVESFTMDMDRASYETTPDGSRPYVMIPTEFVMTIEGAGTNKLVGNTLAIENEGVWYLISTDEPNEGKFISSIYPEFEGVTFSPRVIEPVQ